MTKTYPRPRRQPARCGLLALCVSTLAFLTIAHGQSPVITEFMASNDDTLEIASLTPDWIEIHNPGAGGFDLAGWHLTDDSGDLNKWTFPAGATIPAGDYLLVYGANDAGLILVNEYSVNFQLSSGGEYLALVRPDGTVEQEFAPAYPDQETDISYGLPAGGGAAGYFLTPTPGAANGAAVDGFVRDTTFSHKRGFYDATFQLEVTTATPGATIYYTTDGTTPDVTSTQAVAPNPLAPPTAMLAVTTTTIVRAFAAKPGFASTNIDTQTYLFVDDVIASGSMSPTITGNAVWGPQMRDALLEIPSFSLVTQGDIPTTPIASPPEIPLSVEMIFPGGGDGFQFDAGVERFGGQFTVFPKLAMRISFKDIYGPKRLNFDLFGDTPYGGDTAVDSFDQILLRNGSQDCLFGWQYPHSRATYVRNRYFFDRQIEMGHLSMRGRFVHAYHNGDYVGIYHLMERPNADFMAQHQGGDEEDYDIMRGRSGITLAQGTQTAWNFLQANLNDYAIVQENMDVDNYIDYMLLNFYGGNEHDWYPQHNWVAGRKRETGGKWQFFMWDNDFLIRRGGGTTTGSTANVTDNGGPANMLATLDNHEDFVMRMADRAQQVFFKDGMLTPQRVKADIEDLAESVSRVIIPEAARWSEEAQTFDSRNTFYTPDSFQSYVDWITDVNAQTRTDVVIGQMRAAGLFPSIDAPELTQDGGDVSAGFLLGIEAEEGTVYYTTDGSDPREDGGTVSAGALVAPTPTAEIPVVNKGATWNYLDDGSDQGTAWSAVGFDDSAWASGPAPLGFGGITNTTVATQVLQFFPRPLTFYARHEFELSDADPVLSASVAVHADDGAVVYLNGAEVVRDNMPAGVITFDTEAVTGGQEGVFDSYTIDHSLLVEGTNILAVEAHNERATSGDMVMDLELLTTQLVVGAGIPINETTTVKARTLHNGEWSTLTEATFTTNAPASSANLVISEIHYHPSDTQGDEAEFVELMNISGDAIDLGGVAFTAGIDFTFAAEAVLAAGARVVLVADATAFEAAYGAAVGIDGTFTSRLGNGGERLTLNAADGSVIQTVRFDDTAPWPEEADGDGYSLVLIAPTSAPDHELAQHWRASVLPGGTPGGSDAVTFTGNPATDLLTYALGEPVTLGVESVDGVFVLEFESVAGADDAVVHIELSTDLVTWTPAAGELLQQSFTTRGQVTQQWQFTPGAFGRRHYARLIVTLRE